MRASPSPHPRHFRSAVVLVAAIALTSAPSAAAAADLLGDRGWTWPVVPVRIVRVYEAPAHPYGPGHRGIDVAGTDVVAPADGVVAFTGDVAGRGVLTIDHGGGLVSSYEPVHSDLAVTDRVTRGQHIAVVTGGGHSAPGTVHVGVRMDGEYVNPLRLLGGVPRAVLLPCC